MRWHSILRSQPDNRQLTPPLLFLRGIGLIHPAVTGIVGSGVVVHIPSFFDEVDALREEGEQPSFSHTRFLA